MRPQSKPVLFPPSWRDAVSRRDSEPSTLAPDSIPQARYGEPPAGWTDDTAVLQSIALALEEAERRLCDLVREDPAPPASLLGLFVKDVTRLRREEQVLRDQLAANRRLGACLRRALATRRLTPLLRFLTAGRR